MTKIGPILRVSAILAIMVLGFLVPYTPVYAAQVEYVPEHILIEKNGGTSKVTNLADGFSLTHPAGMQVDANNGSLQTVIYDERTRIEIYHEKFSNKSAEEYIYYSNAPIYDGRDNVDITKNNKGWHKGYRVYQLWWTRPPLKHIPGDKNYYAVIDIKTGPREVYSLHFKTSDPSWLDTYTSQILEGFTVFEPSSYARSAYFRGKERKYPLFKETQEFLNNQLIEKQKWGLFEPAAPEDTSELKNLEEMLDYRFQYLLVYSNINSILPKERLIKTEADGRYLQYTLQTLLPEYALNKSIMYGLLKGEYDDYLHSFARSMAEYGKPVLFRLNNEMNGDWCGYSAYYSSQDPELYKAFWRYLYEVFHQEGADNVLWVFNPNDKSFPDFKWNHAMMYYPGDEYVDIIGLTGYNTGNYYPGEYWRDFQSIYAGLYNDYRNYFGDKPFIITEFGASTYGGNKADWIKTAMEQLKHYPQIKLAVWWNHIDWDGGKKARIYRLEDEASISAFKEGLALYM